MVLPHITEGPTPNDNDLELGNVRPPESGMEPVTGGMVSGGALHSQQGPEDGGLVALPPFHQEQMRTAWAHQEAFLHGYASGGTISAGLAVAGIDRSTVSLWRKRNYMGFNERFEIAHQMYCDVLEDKVHELTMGLKPGQNALLLLARLNAEMPAKYRPAVVATDETAKELMTSLRQLRRQLPPPSEETGQTTEERMVVLLERKTTPATPAGLSDSP